MEYKSKLELALETFYDRHDESSLEFKEYLLKHNIETEKVEIPYYSSPSEFLWKIANDEEKLKYYTFIDKPISDNIKRVLIRFNYEDFPGDISSILKKGYYKVILARLNVEFQEKHKGFAKEFYELYKLLSKEINRVKIHTNVQAENLDITNKKIIDLITESIKDQILKSQFCAEYITDFEFKKLGFDINEEEFYIINTCLDLLDYIRFKNIVKNDCLGDLFEHRLYKGECELIYALIEAAGLINEAEIKSPEANYIRSKLTNHYNKALKDIDNFSENIIHTEDGFELNFEVDDNQIKLNGELINEKSHNSYLERLNVNIEKLKQI